uniref:8-hydroxyquercetin 8-O-methyltransferase n=1 Tax=Mentha piperita TaxID=34256 RepID=Q8OMT_MENPI|nr:RecName: Full=8-hydroxyquercetin 8-O-methyltransferase; AltName: Full=7,8,4'-trihydroxy-flavone 8-O-methyltransferase; AltName: Full=8-hydroxy-flavone 8-O-methyltransferase; AltName: Full=Flavonoid 8-O-methyltransferase [Mentha x piperita]AAR09600.1 flavonoid 8-O-methyltransferase [Mentha x piperita]
MALPNGISSKQELLEAQAHVWNHIYSYINSMSLKCAIQLGIPDAIHKHGNPITLSQLADALNINKAKSHGLFRLMRILVHSGFFDKVKVKVKVEGEDEEEEEDAYSLTPASRLLLRSEPLSVAPFALAMSDPVYTETWHHLSEWFRNDAVAAFDTKYGMTFPEYAVADDRLNVLFNEAMACDAGFVNSILTTECREIFDGLESMVDVGGGTGATAKGIAAAFPGMECTVLDLPNVVGGLKGSENLSFVSGDMFDFIPHADAIFMKFILHDWNDEECVKILKKCKEAISRSNNSCRKIILVEIVMEDEKETHEATETKLFFDMQMLAIITGKERSEKEWGKLFFDAGFTNYKITRVLGLRSVIEVFP